jgi:hypothetical protein
MKILRLLSSRPLPCGCLVGMYETYGGPVVSILDARADHCADRTHRPGARVEPAGLADDTDMPERVAATACR